LGTRVPSGWLCFLNGYMSVTALLSRQDPEYILKIEFENGTYCKLRSRNKPKYMARMIKKPIRTFFLIWRVAFLTNQCSQRKTCPKLSKIPTGIQTTSIQPNVSSFRNRSKNGVPINSKKDMTSKTLIKGKWNNRIFMKCIWVLG